MFRLDGEKAVVTGGGQGLGKEMAIALAEAGADVAVMDRRLDAGEETAEEIKKLGREAIAIKGDVSKEEDVKNMVDVVIENFVKVDVLVNNAGIGRWKAAEDMTLEEWQEMININLTGEFLCCKWVGREMIKKKKGSLINISSMSGYIVNIPQKQCHYNTAKAGVHHLTRSLAVEWAYLTPMKRIGDPSEIKGLCVFLASRASSYITGASILIDGGYSLQ